MADRTLTPKRKVPTSNEIFLPNAGHRYLISVLFIIVAHQFAVAFGIRT